MSEQADAFLQDFTTKLDALLSPYTGRVDWGNVRRQVSHWQSDEGELTNFAIIYESPGGSTNQINVSFDPRRTLFRVLNEETQREEEVADVDEALRHVKAHVQSIPEKRRQRLQTDIDRWVSEEASQAQILATLNKLLRFDLIGGRVTEAELQEGVRYVVQAMRRRVTPPTY